MLTANELITAKRLELKMNRRQKVKDSAGDIASAKED